MAFGFNAAPSVKEAVAVVFDLCLCLCNLGVDFVCDCVHNCLSIKVLLVLYCTSKVATLFGISKLFLHYFQLFNALIFNVLGVLVSVILHARTDF